MDYQIITPRGRVLTSERNAACWSPIAKAFWGMAHKTPCHPKYYPLGGGFRIRLLLDTDSLYFKHTSTPDRNLSDKIFDKLFGEIMHPDWWYGEYDNKPRLKARTAIVYTHTCPFWVAIASASLYRMHADMSNFLHHWKQIDVCQREIGYRVLPWVQYFLASNLSNHGNAHTDFMNTPVSASPNNNHMPIDGNAVDIPQLQFLCGWTRDRLVNGSYPDRPKLLSMYQEVQQLNKSQTSLLMTGRDSHFVGGSAAGGCWILKAAEAAGISMHHESKLYCAPVHTMALPDFYEKVLIPNRM